MIRKRSSGHIRGWNRHDLHHCIHHHGRVPQAVRGFRSGSRWRLRQSIFLLGFAGALRCSELVVGSDVEHVTWTRCGLKLLIGRSKGRTRGAKAPKLIPRARVDGTCQGRLAGRQPPWPVRWVRPQWRPGPRNHGSHSALRPDHHAQLPSTLRGTLSPRSTNRPNGHRSLLGEFDLLCFMVNHDAFRRSQAGIRPSLN